MRFSLLALFIGLCAASSIPQESSNYSQQQKDVWRLFKYINQPSHYKDHVEIASSWHLHEHEASYSKPGYVHQLVEWHKYGMLLKKGEIFSIFHGEHLKQAVVLFKLFYHANSWEDFYHTAVWARQHVNEGMFLYSFSVALIHRPDTYYFSLPPIYEIYPYYFYSTEVIQKAQHYKQMYYGHDDSYNDKIIYANYSGWYMNLHPEQALSYFMEDVGVNSMYYYYNLYYPFWMDGEEFKLKTDNRGEVFYFMYQQILARFYLERLSHGFGEIDHFNWEVPFETPYYPSLSYRNGLPFPERPNFAHLWEYFYNYGQSYGMNKYAYSYTFVKNYETRIHDVIDSGYALTKSGEKVGLFTHEGINILGNLIEGNPESPYYKYYGAYQVFARHLLGYSHQPLTLHKLHPSALEHFETSMRDPAFYQLYKKLMYFFIKFKAQHHHHYTEHDLIYSGVEVKKMKLDPLVTYFDMFYADLSNAVWVTPEEFAQDTFKVQVGQKRLTHKPFTYKIYVNSEKDTDVVVKVFMGPKYDEYGRYINLTDNWMNFVQFDHFEYKLKSGENVITKSGKEIYSYMHDRTSYYELYKKAMGAYEKDHKFEFYNGQFWYGFPQRMMLPMGSQDGVPYQFFVMVYKSLPYKTEFKTPMVGSGMQYVDAYPMGYPFDRPVYYEQLFHDLPNTHFHDVKIFHHYQTDDIMMMDHGEMMTSSHGTTWNHKHMPEHILNSAVHHESPKSHDN